MGFQVLTQGTMYIVNTNSKVYSHKQVQATYCIVCEYAAVYMHEIMSCIVNVLV